MRYAEVVRKTNETDIRLTVELDGSGRYDLNTGCGFLDHMLTLFARHSRCDLTVSCAGDTRVDYHHTVEDIGIALGEAVKSALGDKRGINRYGSAVIPMDEALIMAALDISGRGGAFTALEIPAQKVGDFDTELVKEFFIAFALNAGVTLHIRQLAGENSHHIIEGAFKAFARAFRAAKAPDADFPEDIPSTKGVL